MEDLFEKWSTYLDRLDMNHKGFEIFDHTSGKLSVKELRIIMKGGLEELMKKIDDIRDRNECVEYAMFKSMFRAFLNEEGIEYRSTENDINEDDFRSEFECHINWNIEKMVDFPVLLIDTKRYPVCFNWEHNEIDESDPEQKMFKDFALKYISEEQLDEILIHSFDGTGFFGIIISGHDIIKAIKDHNNIVSSSEMVIGIHDEFNGSGYYKRVNIKDSDYRQYVISLDKAELDWGRYSLGCTVSDSDDWKWE